MRNKIRCMDDWKFVKKDVGVQAAATACGEVVSLPHTWNAEDGQDGGNDFYRGTCWYVKELVVPESKDGGEVWMEFAGAAMRAKVYVNGSLAGSHDGGYSTFRVNLTEYLREQNIIAVSVDNSPNREVYPQKADFTFYGGIYREVSLLMVPKGHFALGYHGGSGIKVSTEVQVPPPEVKLDSSGVSSARVIVEVMTEQVKDGTAVTIEIDGVGQKTATIADNRAEVLFEIAEVHLWNGKKDPYLYTASAVLAEGEDSVSARFGCRSFSVDSEKGFFLNGVPYPLCGAARHQDRLGVGNALTREMHEEDMQIMLEMGANTVRMAHYQHDQYFYDLADEYGMIVWAEIPYISEHMPEGRENTISQMTELIIQNYNHPSVICWALSNEITITGGVTEDLMENHRILNALCHELDPTRLTTMAHVFVLGTDEEIVTLPDIRSYNLYHGWYVGEMEDNDSWFDEFHGKYPHVAIGLSEYGADANPQYHSPNPEKGDYTEEYQALYHEHMLAMWKERPFIWAMHVWNMFDFAADGREEGGKPGQNQKGLVTFDRNTRKDAFYIYKAYLSEEKFVHLCGRRYVDRTEDETEIKVYSNLHSVTLLVDGEEVGTKCGEYIFTFHIPINGVHRITAESEECRDEMQIRKVAESNPAYLCPGREVTNWFENDAMEIKEGFYSIKDSSADIKADPQAAALLAGIMQAAAASYGDVAKNVQIPEEMQRKMDAMPLESSLKMAGKAVTPDMIVELNRSLQQIPKAK